jgi:hypothetical protein
MISAMPSDAPETMTLRPSRGKALLMLLIGVVFTASGILMVRDGRTMGWFVLIFFALCTVIFVTLLLPNAAYLRLSPEGFEIRSIFRSFRNKWSDVTSFHAGRVGLNPMVLITFAPSYAVGRKARAVSSALTGGEGGLPDTYGRSAKELAALLNEWRARYAGPVTPS